MSKSDVTSALPIESPDEDGLDKPTAGQVPTPVHTSTLTPDQLADRAIAAIDPSTVVSVDQNRRIAGRAAYELVLSPKDATARVGSVHIGIDAQRKLPLSVQVARA